MPSQQAPSPQAALDLDQMKWRDEDHNVSPPRLAKCFGLAGTPSTLITLYSFVESIDNDATRLWIQYHFIKAAVRLNSFILLPPILTEILHGFEEYSDATTMVENHRILLSHLGKEEAVLPHVGQVVEHLLGELERIRTAAEGGSDTPVPPLPTSLVDVVFKRYLTPMTLGPLMAYIASPGSGVVLQERHWRHAASVAYQAGMHEDGIAYTARASKNLAEEYPELTGLHPVHIMMGAQRSTRLTEAIKVLMPLIERLDKYRATKRLRASITTTDDDDPEFQDAASLPSITEDEADEIDAWLNVMDTSPQAMRAVVTRIWSILLTRAARDRSLAAGDLIAAADAMPDVALCAATLTPLMFGLMKRGELDRARHVWYDMKARHGTALPSERHRMLDSTALAVAAQLQFLRRSRGPTRDFALQETLKLVEYYAARGGVAPHMPPLVKGIKVRNSVPLDARVVNKLLHMCAWTGRVSVALRVWSAARPRWGVLPNDLSLALLIDSARFCTTKGTGDFGGGDMFRRRLKILASAFHLPGRERQRHPGSPLDKPAEYWVNYAGSCAKDPLNYDWWREHAAAPWEEVRQLFRNDILFANYPGLKDVPSPLTRSSAFADFKALIAPPSLAGAPLRPMPLGGKYAFLIPGYKSFRSYIELVATYFAEDDMGEVIAWMRALDVKPDRASMLVALTYVGETEGPRHNVRIDGHSALVRDEHVLRAYLCEWLGEGGGVDGATVPTEMDVARYRRARMRRIEKQDARKHRQAMMAA